MKVILIATNDLDSLLKEHGHDIGFSYSEIKCEESLLSRPYVEIDLQNSNDFFQLICNLSAIEELVISSANEHECHIEFYNDYREC